MTEQADQGSIVILLAVHNGAAFLRAQLDSFTAQSYQNWQVFAGDDGSTDDSREILTRFAEQALTQGNHVEIVDGPCAGTSAIHFLSLLTRAPDAPWMAFSDQDDVWLPDKLARAVAALEPLDPTRPTLYCSRTWVTDEDLGTPVLSRNYTRPLGFRNALLQNIAAGNTIVLNRAAADLARRAAPHAMCGTGVQGHDWWLYQLITGAGGQIIQDSTPTLYYRQHGRNLVGANHGFAAAVKRTMAVLNGVYLRWNAANIAALEPVCDLLTPENRSILRGFAALGKRPLLARIHAFRRLGLYRQTRFTQAAVWVALLLGRL
jgi:glycosyltransferase involved in cell wall biosynthesis